ncbi:MAG TPA: AMP-binding protein [Stellaceae bacterium]|nr:AMP-binding protein [Stellaceae bacterium]
MSGRSVPEFPWGDDDTPVGSLLSRFARQHGDHVYCRFGDRDYSVSEIETTSNRLANALMRRGIGAGARVGVMLDHHPDHVLAFFALAKLGAVMVPLNVHLRGDSLEHLLRDGDLASLIVEARLAQIVLPIVRKIPVGRVIWRGPPAEGDGEDLAALLTHIESAPPAHAVAPDDLAVILYTSGTTGLPKGVLLSDRMVRISACAAGRMAGARDRDVFLMWEPINHIGGLEVLVLATLFRITLVMVERFSVSRFWPDARQHGVTQLHFLGGVLALLLKAEPRPDDREHRIRVAWGGGCPVSIWRAFEERFGIPVREGYGMTECASFTTQNLTGKLGSVGPCLPYFEMRVADEQGRFLGSGKRGELWVRGKQPGVVTQGYWRNPAATAALFEGEWLKTGDIGWYDEDGDFFYSGRKKDSIRRRGENVAAFEVERVLSDHPAIAESAVIGVPNALADEDIKAVVRLKTGETLDPLALVQWCESRLAYFQIPRYVSFVDSLPKTPSERIRKDALSRSTEDCWDLERSGYKLRR